ncbi:MAG: MFS transporter [Candidatus Thorarchaeota archaeon]
MIIEITLLIIFLIFFVIGFYIIYRQVALVKKGEFRNKDRLQCIIYGIIFSVAVMVVIAVAFIFAIELWGTPSTELNSLVLLIPFIFSLIYISVYPLIDFLFIAISKESDEGLTPFHKFISSKVINRYKRKSSKVISACLFYLIVFFLPPIILSIIGLPFIMIWVTWVLIYPLMILTFYGSKGYIAGISNAYYHIPNINRSIFLNFEDSKRGLKQFLSDPGPYIILGLMIFVFIWAWISLFQTIAYFFTGKLAISTMSSYFVFVTLIFGILGYFTRFWGRKIKYRGIDIYFAAYLMASIGINVLVNFLIVNPENLSDAFSIWGITSLIVPNFLKFAWAAVIEEIVLIIFTSYFLLARNSEFLKNIRYSKITECGQAFDPIPLFNLITNRDSEIRKHAEDTLLLMFERIPLKSEINLNKWKFKNILMDGISSPNPHSRRICHKILVQLEKDIPALVLPWIIESLDSPNYDRNIPVLESILNTETVISERLTNYYLMNLLNDADWRIKLMGIKLLRLHLKKKRDLISKINIIKLFDDPSSKIQVELLNLFKEFPHQIPKDQILDKMFHSNKEVSAAAIKNLRYLDQSSFDSKFLSKIIHLMEDPSSSVRASIFDLLGRVGNFKKNKVPILPFQEGLIDLDESVRKSSMLALERYFIEEPKLLDLDEIIKKIDSNNYEILDSILMLLGRLWENNPEKILTTLLNFIKIENNQLKENISNIIIEKYTKNPNLIIRNLIKIPDDSGYITKGIVANTFIALGKTDPKNIIQILIESLENTNNNIKINALNSLDGLVEEFPIDLDLEPVGNLIKGNEDIQIKKEASKLISRIAKIKPKLIHSLIPVLLNSIPKQESSLKIVIFKSIQEIAKTSPNLIQIQTISNFLSDHDSFVREICIKILGIIGYKNPIFVTDILVNEALLDEDWIVREAAVSSLGTVIIHLKDKKKIIEKLTSLLDDKQGWVRRSALMILSQIEELDKSYLPFTNLLSCLTDEDAIVRSAAISLLKIYRGNFENIFDSLVELLGDSEKEVRTSMINTSVAIIQELGLEFILSKLLQNLSDTGSIEIQRSISLILGRTARYEEDKIKKRVISVLKIRCEMSQDPIICGTLQQLKES